MDRLAEQVVAWHNRHPLAKRITLYDVHTIGVVALPFMRSGPATPAGKVEPVFNDALSAEDLARVAALGSPASHAAKAQQQEASAAAQSIPSTAPTPPIWRKWAARPGQYWAAWRAKFSQTSQRSGTAPQVWPAFSERFVTGLSPQRIAAFAKNHGFASLPGDADWPLRIVPFDDGLMADSRAAAGAWPFELYLLSAGIDAGNSRTRILLGQGRPSPAIGRRCLSPQRQGLAGLLALGLIAVVMGLFWPSSIDPQTNPAAAAAPAATSTTRATAAAQGAASNAATAASELASGSASPAPAAAGSTHNPVPALAGAQQSPASAPKKTTEPPLPAPVADAASEPPPDIRPQFVKPIPKRPARSLHTPEPDERLSETRAARAVTQADPKPAPALENKPASKAAEPISKGKALGQIAGAGGQTVVALVGPTSRSRAEAESMLLRMRTLIEPTQANPAALQAQVFQTPDGWRPAVWPFASREEAQLINATLIARGLRVKAVDF